MESIRRQLDQLPPKRGQVIILLVCLLLNISDGFDVMAMSYAAPYVARAWSVSPQSLGAVFSAALAGMAVGSMFLSPIADSHGRKTTIVIAGVLVSLSMFATAMSSSLWHLIALRFLAGVGIGIIVPISATLASEYSPATARSAVVLLVASGFSVGLTLAGLFAEDIIASAGWQGMFITGGAISLLLALVSARFVRESVYFLAQSNMTEAMKISRINRTLLSLKHSPITSLESEPDREERISAHRIFSLFSQAFFLRTALIWCFWFSYYWGAYIITNWLPTLFVYNGYEVSQGIEALTFLTSGVLVGGLALGIVGMKKQVAPIAALMLFLAAALIAVFALVSLSFEIQKVLLALVGFMLSANYGLYALVSSQYPTSLRATGVGAAIGFGRVGAMVSPAVAGFVISEGWSLEHVLLFLVTPSLVATSAIVIAVHRLPNRFVS